MSLASVHHAKLHVSLSSNSLNLLDELIPPRWLSNHTVAATPQDSDAPEKEFKSCFTCGVTWYDDHVSLDCSECGGYALERPCPDCDGNCGAKWQRDLAKSHGYQKAYWLGNCRRAPSTPQHNKMDGEQKTTDASEGLSMSLDKMTVKNS